MFVIIALGISVLGFFLTWSRTYHEYKNAYGAIGRDLTVVPTTLSKFKDLYYINPEKFELGNVPFFVTLHQYQYAFYTRNFYSEKKIVFKLSFTDWLLYIQWIKDLEKEKEAQRKKAELVKRTEQDKQALESMYKDLLSDIEQTRKQGQKYINQARDTMKGINNSI